VLLAGMLAPRNLGTDYAADFDAVFPRLAEKHGVAFYPFLLDGVALDPALNQADGIHPNPAGVAVIVDRLAPRLGAMIEALAKRQSQAGGGSGG
jgi:acyl-CoA thioesterase-1